MIISIEIVVNYRANAIVNNIKLINSDNLLKQAMTFDLFDREIVRYLIELLV